MRNGPIMAAPRRRLAVRPDPTSRALPASTGTSDRVACPAQRPRENGEDGEVKVGVLTGGGDCPGLNAVIRAVARRSFQRGHEVVGVRDGWRGLVEDELEPLGA